VGEVARAIEAEFAPVKLNLFTLGNMVPHLHTHVVPRFLDDPFPGGLIPWDDMFTSESADPTRWRSVPKRSASACTADPAVRGRLPRDSHAAC